MSLSHIFEPINARYAREIEFQCLESLRAKNMNNLPEKIIKGDKVKRRQLI